MTSFSPQSLMISVETDVAPHLRMLTHPAAYQPHVSRKVLHEALHLWQLISRPYLWSMAAEELERLTRFESTGQVSAPGALRADFTRVDDEVGFSAENIYSYRPGSRTVVFQEGDALLIKAGQRIAIQFHYNTRGAKPADSYPKDQSPLRLWTLPKGQTPMRQIHRQPVHALNITIPVGAKNQSVRTQASLEARAPAEIIGISPHMHLLGQRFKQTLNGGGVNDLCLVEVPDWEEGWQIDYLFKPSEYIKAQAGMTISQECVYSNGPEDQGIGPDGKPYTPQLTTFGEDTRQEMCLGYVWYRQPYGGGAR
jgi:hypothetical protein